MTFDSTSIQNTGNQEIFITLIPDAKHSLTDLFNILVEELKEKQAVVLKVEGYGPVKSYNSFESECKKAFTDESIPMMYVTEQKVDQGSIAGIQVHAVAGCTVHNIKQNERIVGQYYQDDFTKTLIATGIGSGNPSASRNKQTLMTLENLENILTQAGLDMLDIQRTWFFNDQILDWYSDFNSVRTKYYRERSVFDRYLPASTGMGGGHPNQEALSVGLLAQKALSSDVQIREIPSPKQCSAYDYGSSFSRAVEFSTPDEQRIYVSGTASIDAEGNTIHVGNLDAQIHQTIDVVQAILHSRGMDFSNVTCGIAYFKHPDSKTVWPRYADQYGLPQSRILVVSNDICRDDLLFEIEVDAIVKK